MDIEVVILDEKGVMKEDVEEKCGRKGKRGGKGRVDERERERGGG